MDGAANSSSSPSSLAGIFSGDAFGSLVEAPEPNWYLNLSTACLGHLSDPFFYLCLS